MKYLPLIFSGVSPSGGKFVQSTVCGFACYKLLQEIDVVVWRNSTSFGTINISHISKLYVLR